MKKLTNYKKIFLVIGFVICFNSLLITTGLFITDKIDENLSFFVFVPSFILMIILVNIYKDVPLKSLFSGTIDFISKYKSKLKKS